MDVADLERRVDYLSVQVERLIDLHRPFPSPMTQFRKAAMLCALSFEEEALARKLLGVVQAFNNGEEVDIHSGLLPLPAETVQLYNEYAAQETINSDQAKAMLKTVVSGGDVVTGELLTAWESAQSMIRSNDEGNR